MENVFHAGKNPEATIPLIDKLSCSLAGVSQVVCIVEGSLAHRAYGKKSTVETFQCQYGLNEKYRRRMGAGHLKITGLDKQGHARIVELQDHPFFLASLFLPQLSSQPGRPHPLIRFFMHAAHKL